MADSHATSTSASQSHVTPPELEQTLTLLTSHRCVLGYMLLSRGQPVTIIRHSGVVFEGEQGKKYASAIARIVQSVQTGLEEVSGGHNEGVSPSVCDHGLPVYASVYARVAQDDIRFMRIRTKRHEIMISPGAPFCRRRRHKGGHGPLTAPLSPARRTLSSCRLARSGDDMKSSLMLSSRIVVVTLLPLSFAGL